LFWVAAGLVYIFFAHYISDFILQTEWMATTKSKSLKPLAAHITVYTGSLIAFGSLFTLVSVPFSTVVSFCLLNGILHMATDFCTSKVSSWAFENKRISLFWAVIGFDQFVHIATFILTLAWYLN
jgi:hypothetical protein